MSQFDLHNIVKSASALNIQNISTDTTINGNVIDALGFDAFELVIQTGNDLDATTVFTPAIYESDDASFVAGVTLVPAQYLIGTTNVTGERPSYGVATDPIGDATFVGVAKRNMTARIGVLNKKRYVRLSMITTLKTTGGTIGATAILGFPQMAPTAKS